MSARHFPFFTVIIPTYNRTELLWRAIRSVCNQSFENYECYIIDDGSDQPLDSADINNLSSHFHYHYSAKNRGVSWARNQGLKAAGGEWICLLDSDDQWHPEKLQQCYEYLQDQSLENKSLKSKSSENQATQSKPTLKIFQTNEEWIRNGNRVTPPQKYQKVSGDLFERSLQYCAITPSSVVLHRSLLDEGYFFDQDLPACEDYELWLRITDRYPVGLLSKNLTVRYQGHEGQLSFRYPLMDLFRVRALEKFVRQSSNPSHRLRAYQAFLEKWEILLQGARKRKRYLFLLSLHFFRLRIQFYRWLSLAKWKNSPQRN